MTETIELTPLEVGGEKIEGIYKDGGNALYLKLAEWIVETTQIREEIAQVISGILKLRIPALKDKEDSVKEENIEIIENSPYLIFNSDKNIESIKKIHKLLSQEPELMQIYALNIDQELKDKLTARRIREISGQFDKGGLSSVKGESFFEGFHAPTGLAKRYFMKIPDWILEIINQEEGIDLDATKRNQFLAFVFTRAIKTEKEIFDSNFVLIEGELYWMEIKTEENKTLFHSVFESMRENKEALEIAIQEILRERKKRLSFSISGGLISRA